MAEFKKSDAIDLAHNIKLMVDALVDEGFDECRATEFVMELMAAGMKKPTFNTLF